MKKTIVIGISLLFFIGLTSQTSARKIHCWDNFIQNYECDIEEDINGDGKCNRHDCEEPCYAILQTGQTLCYDTVGNEIVCTGTGQDGDYQYGTSWPEPRFTDNLNGTITDNLTGLIWLQIANCGGLKTWANALTFANSLANNDCELSDGSAAGDWRLPNIRELQSLIDFSNYGQALPSGHPFLYVQGSLYWSSTTYVDGFDSAWYVNMNSGHVYAIVKDDTIYVWPVRGGK